MSASMTKANDTDWWRGAVVYQVYPRSYKDSNGDGIGDLNGITEKLPYIASIGADAVWISPFFKSPMKDFGYDVSDYRDIDPMFGDLDAFDALIARAHSLGLKIIIDLVLSHTSDQHSWFAQSSSSHDNERKDWYVWRDAKPDGTAPTNWLSIFGGPAWTWNTTRKQYYLHNFLSSQPDLNFHCEAVQDALLDVARFWLERGVDGFRLDTINFYFCDKQFRDNPALPEAERNSDIAPEVNPYNYQDHIYDKNQPENLIFLERLRTAMDAYPGSAAVGEIGDAQYGMRLLNEYTEGTTRMHMCYTFEMLSPTNPSARRVADVLTEFEDQSAQSWVCWAFSNHDVVRHATRWSTLGGGGEALAVDRNKLLASLLMSLKGSACLYQGEELGFPEADVAFEDLQDPYGIQFWPQFKGRDGCRTPMAWSEDGANAGFSTAKPWLPIAQEHRALAADQQENSTSLLSHYRQFIRFRKSCLPLVKGTLSDIDVHGDVLSFTRRHEEQSIRCVFNLSSVPHVRAIPGRVLVTGLSAAEGKICYVRCIATER